MAGRQALGTLEAKGAEFATIHRTATTSAPFGQIETFQPQETRETTEVRRIGDPSKNKAIVGKEVTGTATLFHANNPKEVGMFFNDTQPTTGGWLGSETFTMADTYDEKADYWIALWDSTITGSAALVAVVELDDVVLNDWSIDVTGGQPIKYSFSFSGDYMSMSPAAGIGA